jgi:hypothetical protein
MSLAATEGEPQWVKMKAQRPGFHGHQHWYGEDQRSGEGATKTNPEFTRRWAVSDDGFSCRHVAPFQALSDRPAVSAGGSSGEQCFLRDLCSDSTCAERQSRTEITFV